MNTPLNILAFLIFISIMPHLSLAQENTITGHWLNESGEGTVEIYKGKNGKFYGKLSWLKQPYEKGQPKKDKKNKDASLRNRPLIGLVLLKGFTKEESSYTGGTIYDPENGNTYSCKITPIDKDTLSIRGYIGISLIGRTTIWTRTTP